MRSYIHRIEQVHLFYVSTFIFVFIFVSFSINGFFHKCQFHVPTFKFSFLILFSNLSKLSYIFSCLPFYLSLIFSRMFFGRMDFSLNLQLLRIVCHYFLEIYTGKQPMRCAQRSARHCATRLLEQRVRADRCLSIPECRAAGRYAVRSTYGDPQ